MAFAGVAQGNRLCAGHCVRPAYRSVLGGSKGGTHVVSSNGGRCRSFIALSRRPHVRTSYSMDLWLPWPHRTTLPLHPCTVPPLPPAWEQPPVDQLARQDFYRPHVRT
jgi:hypothetical protein